MSIVNVQLLEYYSKCRYAAVSVGECKYVSAQCAIEAN